MSKLLVDTSGYCEAGYEQASIDAVEARNAMVRQFLASPLADHLLSMEDSELLDASGGTLLDVASIREEISSRAPGAIIFPLGYMPIWTSIGGNVVVYGVRERAFYWVDHTAFDADTGTMFLQGTNNEIEYNQGNATEAMLALSNDMPKEFIEGLLNGDYEDQLDALD